MELKFACGYHIFLALQRQISVKELAQRLLYIILCTGRLKNFSYFSIFCCCCCDREMKTLLRCLISTWPGLCIKSQNLSIGDRLINIQFTSSYFIKKKLKDFFFKFQLYWYRNVLQNSNSSFWRIFWKIVATLLCITLSFHF